MEESFKDLLLWIKSNIPNSFLETDFNLNLYSWIANNEDEIIELTPVKTITEEIITIFKNNLLSLFNTLQNAKPRDLIKAEKKIQKRFISFRFLKIFLYNYLKENGLNTDKKKIKKLIDEWLNFLNQDWIEYNVISPLNNFEFEGKEIILNEKIKIKKLNKEEEEKINHENFEFFSFTNWRILISVLLRENFIAGNEKNIFQPILGSFRLASPEWVRTGLKFIQVGANKFNERKTKFMSRSLMLESLEKEKYKVHSSEMEDFIKQWNKHYDSLSLLSDYPFWLSRYFDSYERIKPEDAIVDLIIVIESLFGDSGGEIIHKVSTRLTNLLISDINSTNQEKTLEKKNKLRKEIRDYYHKRSLIVHGENIKITFDEIYKLRKIVHNGITTLLEIDSGYLSQNWKKLSEKLRKKLDFGITDLIPTSENL
ncbi:MAG: hypothetical protein HeimC3_25980 [Candidatus Heimdallarchaeota archaeon LC_3]|nr:MAG: hypothetical protein HeimC3_25980 [Candidatus Heimdallarchaeota archaeon LC_3]